MAIYPGWFIHVQIFDSAALAVWGRHTVYNIPVQNVHVVPICQTTCRLLATSCRVICPPGWVTLTSVLSALCVSWCRCREDVSGSVDLTPPTTGGGSVSDCLICGSFQLESTLDAWDSETSRVGEFTEPTGPGRRFRRWFAHAYELRLSHSRLSHGRRLLAQLRAYSFRC